MSTMNLTLKIWRQKGPKEKGKMETYKVTDISEHMSFLEMMDVLNEQLVAENKEPVAFDHDCREGICGMCSLHINGEPHGPDRGVTTCQLHMRKFKDGDTITIDAEKRQINAEVSDEEFARRKEQWQAPAFKATRGTLYKYIKNVKSASEGCVTDE